MPTKKQLETARRLSRDFDWSKVDALTDEQIVRAAKADVDSGAPTDKELSSFDLIVPAKHRKPPTAAE